MRFAVNLVYGKKFEKLSLSTKFFLTARVSHGACSFVHTGFICETLSFAIAARFPRVHLKWVFKVFLRTGYLLPGICDTP